MELILGITLLLCVFSSKVLYKMGVPTLLAFLAIGMLLGSDGIGGIYFDNAELSKVIANVGLMFIMFYGGMGTNWKTAKPVVIEAGVLATVGVIMTALLVGLFAHFVLGFELLEGMLLGSIISSTDAASVFSILRSNKMGLKGGLAPLLEIESGSNDPIAYMLTTIFIGLIQNQSQNIVLTLLGQIVVGILIGLLLGKVGKRVINKINLDIEGLYPILLIGMVFLTYALSTVAYGNGFLSVYVMGLVIGNSKIVNKHTLVQYFDGISWLMQIFLFLTLGLLVFPSELPTVALNGIMTAVFIIFIARPIVIMIILPFFKRTFKEKLLVSWVGFRGAASIVFAIYPMADNIPIAREIFNIVFFVAIISVLFQGVLFIPIARKLDLVEEDETVLRTFTDYTIDVQGNMLDLLITKESEMAGKQVIDIDIPENVLIVMIRRGESVITPHGTTEIKEGDKLTFAGKKKQLLEVSERYNKNA